MKERDRLKWAPETITERVTGVDPVAWQARGGKPGRPSMLPDLYSRMLVAAYLGRIGLRARDCMAVR